MRKIAVFAVLMLSLMLSMTMIYGVKASPSIQRRWQEPLYSGYDTFYGQDVVAYEKGEEATLIVKVTNDGWWNAKADVSVRLEIFGENETSTESDVEIEDNGWAIFTIEFTVPEDATSLFSHRYVIFVKFELETDIEWERYGPYTDFVAYSQNQADARELRTELGYWPDAPTNTVFFMLSAENWELWEKADMELWIANDEYADGNFDSAETHYEKSLNYTKEAVSTYVSEATAYKDAMLSLLTSGSGLMNFYGIAFLIGGIGFLLMGIGVVVYLVRKSSSPKPLAA